MVAGLRPFFYYFGSKHRLAKYYPRPQYNTIIEPFAGSAGYSLLYHSARIVLYDLDPTVYGTWNYLIKASADDIRKLPLTFDDVRDLAICQEAKWLIGWLLNHATTHPCNKPSTWMKRGHRPNCYWGQVLRERIASQVDAIRHWKIYNQSYEYAASSLATWFVDPPYQRSGRHYSYNRIDYVQLAEMVRNFQGRVIACGQAGDTWLPFQPLVEKRGLVGMSRELIWTNFPRPTRKRIER